MADGRRALGGGAASRAERRDRWGDKPRFGSAVVADARLARRLAGRSDLDGSRRHTAAAVIGLTATSPRFAALVLYRARAAALRRGGSVLPPLLHQLSVLVGDLVVGDPPVIRPGVAMLGPIVIDGRTEVGEGCVLGGSVTLGLIDGHTFGPTLGRGVTVGEGAKVIGPVRVGDGARIAPGSVVVHDVAPGTTVGGVPAVAVDPAFPDHRRRRHRRQTGRATVRGRCRARVAPSAGWRSTRIPGWVCARRSGPIWC